MQYSAKVSEYLLELLRCGLRGTTPSEKPQEISWSELFAMAKRHSVVSLAYSAICRLPECVMDAKERSSWVNRVNILLGKHVAQEHEYAYLSELFESEGIAYLPLKGSQVCDVYPKPSLREMGDLDILIREEQCAQACDLLNREGYRREPAADHHVELSKPPFLLVELHTNLMPARADYFKYYKDPWARAVPTENTCRYAYSLEDAYIFLLAHSAKHYYECGTGIRSVIDIYLYWKAHEAQMDSAYVRKELQTLDLVTYETQILALAEYWFSDAAAEAARDVEEMEFYILSSATYGTREVQDMNTLRRYSKDGKTGSGSQIAMYFHFVFLPRREMQECLYPVLRRWPILLPFCWVHRWCRILVKKPKSIVQNYRRVKKIKCYEDKKEEK